MEHAVHAIPLIGQGGGGRRQLIRLGHVDLEHIGLDGERASRPSGQREPPAGSTEDDFGALLLGKTGHRKGQRRVGEHAGDQDPFTLEELDEGVKVIVNHFVLPERMSVQG